MQFYSKAALQLIYDQVNRDNPDLPVALTEDNVGVNGKATVSPDGSPRNSKIKFVGKPGHGYNGELTLLFNRINMSVLFGSLVNPVIYLPSSNKSIRTALSAISDAIGVVLSEEDISNIDDQMVPTATPTTYNLNIDPGSAGYIGTLSIVVQTPRLNFYPRSGPGPKSLAYGNTEFGYFGKVASTEVPTNGELVSLLLNARGVAAGTVDLAPGWYKFYFRNKVIFIPCSPVASTVSWNDIYNAGCMYGVNGVGSFPTDTPVNQYRPFSSNKSGQNFYFLPRTLQPAVSDPGPNLYGGVPADNWFKKTEFDLILHVYGGATGLDVSWAKDSGSQFTSPIITRNSTVGSEKTQCVVVTPNVNRWNSGIKATRTGIWRWWPVFELMDLKTDIVGLETITADLYLGMVPLPAVSTSDSALAPLQLGLPKTVEYEPVVGESKAVGDETAPAILGLPKTAEYRPVDAVSENVVVRKTDLPSTDGELGLFTE